MAEWQIEHPAQWIQSFLRAFSFVFDVASLSKSEAKNQIKRLLSWYFNHFIVTLTLQGKIRFLSDYYIRMRGTMRHQPLQCKITLD